MDYSIFEQQLSKIKNLPLPGKKAHQKMAPKERVLDLIKGNDIPKNHKKAAVMALFYPDKDHNAHLLCILRKTYKGVHSNQVAFPGGKVEKEDRDLLQTALRETHEEVGVDPKDINVIKTLTPVYIPPSNFVVQPFIGTFSNIGPFKIQQSEVEDLVEINIDDFLNNDNISTQNVKTSYGVFIKVPVFNLNGYVIWGATAMMLNEIKTILKEVL